MYQSAVHCSQSPSPFGTANSSIVDMSDTIAAFNPNAAELGNFRQQAYNPRPATASSQRPSQWHTGSRGSVLHAPKPKQPWITAEWKHPVPDAGLPAKPDKLSALNSQQRVSSSKPGHTTALAAMAVPFACSSRMQHALHGVCQKDTPPQNCANECCGHGIVDQGAGYLCLLPSSYWCVQQHRLLGACKCLT